MAVSLVLLPAILTLFSYTAALTSQIDTQTSSSSSSSSSSCGNHNLICELDQAKLKLARLESSVEEIIQDLNAKSLYLKEKDNLIEEMTHQIDLLQSSLSRIKSDSSHANERLNVLEEEVRLLWQASRKNNFELHNLESKAQDTENRLEMVTSQVKKMADVVTEQWIQIQQLEQGLQNAEVRLSKVKREISSTKSTFSKFIRTLFGNHPQTLREMVDPFLFNRGSTFDSYMSRALQQLKRIFSAIKKFHHKLQGFIKQEMERNEFPAALASEEVVFFVASAMILLPIMSAWMLLSSRFN